MCPLSSSFAVVLLVFCVTGAHVADAKEEFIRDRDEQIEIMRVQNLAVAALPLAANAINVVLSNDDGWAVSNLRATYYALLDAGYDAIVSAPAENQSGTGSKDAEPQEVEDGCQFQSCPAGSPPTGNNASDTRLNYVNSYPVTSMRYGIEELAPTFFDSGTVDIALAGPNHGPNIGLTTLISGTVGAAVEAASLGVPAIAFSAAEGEAVPWNEPTPEYSQVYADLALLVTDTLTAGGAPYLPENTWLNVNFPAVTEECARASDFKFVLSRIRSSVPLIDPPDVDTCGLNGRLRSERTVFLTSLLDGGCYASISVGDLDKSDGNREKQTAVLERLEPILSCLPE